MPVHVNVHLSLDVTQKKTNPIKSAIYTIALRGKQQNGGKQQNRVEGETAFFRG